MSKHNGLLVLIADDRPSVRQSIRGLFPEDFIQVEEAESGHIAWTKVRNRSRDFVAVIASQRMANLSGLRLVELMRENKPRIDVPVILLVHSDEVEDRVRRAERFGAKVLRYPVRDFDIVHVVEEALSKFVARQKK